MIRKSVMPLQSELYRTRHELRQISAEWDPLLQSSSADTIFLTWEWVTAWLDAVHPQADLFVVAVRDAGRLIGIAPFYRGSFRFVKLVGYTCLRVLGDCHSGAEYPDIILQRGREGEVCSAISQCLEKYHHLWECAWLPNISGWTGALDRLNKVFGQPLAFHRSRPASFSCISLPDTFDNYLAAFSGNFRATLKRQEKKIYSSGEISFEVCDCLEDVSSFLDALFEMHGKRWESVGQKGAFVRRPLMKKFYELFSPVALQQGWLGLFAVRCNGQVAAVQFGYVYRGTFYQLQEGFDPAGPAGSGNILRKYVVNWCIDNKLKEYDFLGQHSLHKQHWQGKERFGHHLFLGQNSPVNYLLAKREFWPRGRFIEMEPYS